MNKMINIKPLTVFTLFEALEDDGPNMDADKRAKVIAQNKENFKGYKAGGDKKKEAIFRGSLNYYRKKTKKGTVYNPPSKKATGSDLFWASGDAKKRLKRGVDKKTVADTARKEAEDSRQKVRRGEKTPDGIRKKRVIRLKQP